MPDFTYQVYFRCLDEKCGWLQFLDGNEPLSDPNSSNQYCPVCGGLVVAEQWAV